MAASSSPVAPPTFFSLLRCFQYHPKPLTSFKSTQSERIVNPHGHRIIEDCYTATLPEDTPAIISHKESKTLSQFCDEELLARFTRGFFGGHVFTPERILFELGLGKVFPVQLEGYLKEGTQREDSGSNIHKPSEIPTDRILPIRSKFYGTFQVIDSNLLRTSPNSSLHGLQAPYSYIDIGFGSGSFGGCHRFSVHRQLHNQSNENSDTERQKSITFSLANFTCNPTDDKDDLKAIKYLSWFHQIYAKLLFADALKGVLGYY